MKKIKLTRAEIKACRDVIAFWKKIEKRLLNKEKTSDGYWEKNNEIVTSDTCPLCEVAKERPYLHSWCENCVYCKAYGYRCYDVKNGHLGKFELNPNFRTCQSAIRSVERILKNRLKARAV